MSDEDTIDRIRDLRSYPIPVIAVLLGLPQSTVRHVLEHGTLPDQDPRWVQPGPDHTSDR